MLYDTSSSYATKVSLCWSSGSWLTMSPVKIENPTADMFKKLCIDLKAEGPKSAVVSQRKSLDLDAGNDPFVLSVPRLGFVESG
jgi:hypothetical protein